MMPSDFDVVVVPDFQSPVNRPVFEARTLFFLGSWLEYAGDAARRFPLHVVCIGEPPASVRTLAERAGATVHVRDRWPGSNVFLNKLRGLEIGDGAGRAFLIDVDVFVLGDFSALADEVPTGIAAAPAGTKRIAEAHWQRIYSAFGLPLPTERAPSLRYELGLVPENQTVHREHGGRTDLRRMLPYYNAGLLLLPRDRGLSGLWVDYTERVRRLFQPPAESSPQGLAARWWRKVQRLVKRRRRPPHTLTGCDQAPFVLTAQHLQAEGVSFRRLPDPYHARWLHCQAGTLGLGQMKIFHATGFLRGWRGGKPELEAAIGDYVQTWQQNFRLGASRRQHPADAEADAVRVGEVVWGLYRKYVAPALPG